jgi:hypothetical protein
MAGMKREEQEELRRREVYAAERQAAASEADVAAREQLRRDEQWERLHRLRNPPRVILSGEEGLGIMAARFPGFAALWDRVVPASHVLEVPDRAEKLCRIILCRCGHQTLIATHTMEKCPGLCGRWFLALEDAVRAHHFREIETEAA